MPIQWKNDVWARLPARQILASVIQGEARTDAGQFAVAAVIFNRATNGQKRGSGGGAFGGGVAHVVNPFAFNGWQTPTGQAYRYADALLAGKLGDFGTVGNALYYAAPDPRNASWANPNTASGKGLFGHGANGIGGNFYSDVMGPPTKAFVGPSPGAKAPAIPPLKPEPALAGSSPGSASASPATKDTPMTNAVTPEIKAEVPNVDFFQGAINTVGHWIGTLTSGLSAAKDPNNTKVSATAGQPGFFGTIGNVQKAIKKLGEIKADAEKKDVQEGVADGVDLLTIGFATMSSLGVNLPAVTAIFASGNINLHAGGIDKPA